MHVIEEYINSKSGNMDKCEDGYFYNEDFIVVVDGVTNKETLSKDDLTGGYIAKEIIINRVKEFPKNITAESALDILSKSIAEKHKAGVKATVILYSNFYKEIWIYGNCQIMINGKRYKYETKVDKLFSTLRSYVIYRLLAEGKTEKELLKKDISREEILTYIKSQSIFENEDDKYGHAVLNGINDDINKMATLEVNIGDEVVIVTDGYPRIYNTLKESEKYLKEVIRKDPLCYKQYKSTKGVYEGNISYDDRTYVRFNV